MVRRRSENGIDLFFLLRLSGQLFKKGYSLQRSTAPVVVSDSNVVPPKAWHAADEGLISQAFTEGDDGHVVVGIQSTIGNDPIPSSVSMLATVN